MRKIVLFIGIVVLLVFSSCGGRGGFVDTPDSSKGGFDYLAAWSNTDRTWIWHTSEIPIFVFYDEALELTISRFIFGLSWRWH